MSLEYECSIVHFSTVARFVTQCMARLCRSKDHLRFCMRHYYDTLWASRFCIRVVICQRTRSPGRHVNVSRARSAPLTPLSSANLVGDILIDLEHSAGALVESSPHGCSIASVVFDEIRQYMQGKRVSRTTAGGGGDEGDSKNNNTGQEESLPEYTCYLLKRYFNTFLTRGQGYSCIQVPSFVISRSLTKQ